MSGIRSDDLERISDLIKILKSSGVNDFSWEKDDEKLALSFSSPVPHTMVTHQGSHTTHTGAPSTFTAPPPAFTAASPEKPAEKILDKNIVEIKSPFVGTFYKRPSPDADPYAEVGDKISKGTVLCIVEAMKLMNEIESEIDGIVEEIVATDTEPVEYGEVLFRIRVKK